MGTMYVVGYSGAVKTLDELRSWSGWREYDPEMQRRTLALMDASVANGTPVGVGSTIRSDAQADALFLSRHVPVASGGCCIFRGQRYAKRPGVAHAAPGGRSFHNPTTPVRRCLAADLTGALSFVTEHAAEFGLKEFSGVNREPWHVQPIEVPNARSKYVPDTMHPLQPFQLPGDVPPPAPVQTVDAPVAVLSLAARRTQPKDQVRHLQHLCNFWQWRDAFGRELLVDGDYGERTMQAVMAMQYGGFQMPNTDGVYTVETQWRLQAFLNAMSAMGS